MLRILPFRRRVPARPSGRTVQRICAVIKAVLRSDKDVFTIDELCSLTGQSAGCMNVALAWMRRLALAVSYWEEPADPGDPPRRVYRLTGHAYKWANEVLLLEGESK